MRQQVGLHTHDGSMAMGASPASSPATTPTHTPPGTSVDQKMAEQLQAFQQQNETLKGGHREDDSPPPSPLAVSGQESSDVEFDSPRRLRTPLGKSHSTGAAMEKKADGKELVRRHTDRAVSDKSPIMEESPSLKAEGQAESGCMLGNKKN